MATLDALRQQTQRARVQLETLERRKGHVPSLPTATFAQRFRSFSHPIPDFHRVWYDALDGPDQRLLLLGPREHAKTSTVLTYVVRRICEDRALRAGILSQSGPLARAFLREISSLLKSPQITDVYGDFAGTSTWNTEQLTVKGSPHSRDVTVFALGAGAQVTGRHTDLLVFDDIESLQTVRTDSRRRSTRAWFAREAMPTLSSTGKAIVIGSRKHFDDLYASLIHPDSGWRYLDNALAAVDDEGTPLWPEMWPLNKLMARKAELDATDVRAWSQEYLNRPIAGELQMFEPESWPTYDPELLRVHREWPRYLGGDFAISERTSADFTAFTIVALDPEQNVYIEYATRGHWTPAQTEQQLNLLQAQYDLVDGGMEAAGFQAPIVREILRKTRTRIRPVRPPADKVTHGRYFQAKAAQGLIKAPQPRPPWWGDFARAFMQFPEGAHDDYEDSAFYALDVALPLSGWQSHFEQEVRAAAEHAEKLTPQRDVCARCLTSIGVYAFESTRFPDVTFCSRQCRDLTDVLGLPTPQEAA